MFRNKKSRISSVSTGAVAGGGPGGRTELAQRTHEARVDTKQSRRHVDPTDARAPIQRG